MAQLVRNLSAMQETWVPSLGWEDFLEQGMATHSSIPAWRIPMDRGAWWATVHRVAKSWTKHSTAILYRNSQLTEAVRYYMFIKLFNFGVICYTAIVEYATLLF